MAFNQIIHNFLNEMKDEHKKEEKYITSIQRVR